MGRLGSPTDWGKMRARGGEEESDKESGDSREGWLARKAASTSPNKKDLPGEDSP